MGIEIERKFLVVGDGWRSAAHETSRMAQGYLNDPLALAEGREQCSVRVRIAGEQRFPEHQVARDRATPPGIRVPAAAGGRPVPCLPCAVVAWSTRSGTTCNHDGHLWEVDEFLGDNHGLVVAEIELQSVDEAFVLPAWAGKEVTEQSRYYNLALAEHPYRSWTDLEKS